MDLEICNLYNLNIINLNELLDKKINIEIENFLYDNNLSSLSQRSKDRLKIYNHFLISNILEVIKEDYNNIFLFEEEKEDYKKFSITKIGKLLNLNIFKYSDSMEIDENIVYKFKSLAENKKKVNIKKIKNFFKKNELTHLSDKIRNNIKTKLVLHK
jgi:hypothetical protein